MNLQKMRDFFKQKPEEPEKGITVDKKTVKELPVLRAASTKDAKGNEILGKPLAVLVNQGDNRVTRRAVKQPTHGKGGNRKTTPGRTHQVVPIVIMRDTKYGKVGDPTGYNRHITHKPVVIKEWANVTSVRKTISDVQLKRMKKNENDKGTDGAAVVQ
jgi:hypothetical protein